jgi:hypothetical protein
MRWSILRTLLHKEALRHLSNRGGLALIGLLVAAAMLLSFFGGSEPGRAGLSPGVRRCFIDYAEDGPLIDHLRDNVPGELAPFVVFRPLGGAETNAKGEIVYPHNTGAIQLRPGTSPGSAGKVWVWHPGADGGSMAPFEVWFWKETLRWAAPAGAWEAERSSLTGGVGPRSALATALVVFGLFFVCVYLLPSLTCEERERGVLLAQALSPASTGELLAAKFLFYPALGMALAAVLAGACEPRALLRGFFWLSLAVSVAGSMGVGLTIASVARTQRAAGLGAMCYTTAVALILFVCQQNGIPGLPWLALEYHCPRILHAALTDGPWEYHRASLPAAAGLAAVWVTAAGVLFRKRGWQ